ncbi:unnamed protein product [Toxocara canis]|uniref:Uncharacterized protein n=1 Tax=Toxocara canis TaxID=6265 RepID=A0A183UT38_TOXCA|nr:unnamed protein product [Toxocara canis]
MVTDIPVSLRKPFLSLRIVESSSKAESSGTEAVSELQEQLKAAKRRENLAVLRLAVKEKQLREVMAEGDWMRDKSGEGSKAEDSVMDHAVGVVFAAMRSELRSARKEAKSAKLELRAIKGQAGNAESKKLAAKCKSLEEQLAEAKVATHRLARLETLLAYSQKTVDGLRRKQRDLDDVLAEHDEEMSRIQTQLLLLQEENARLREGADYTARANSKTNPSRPDSRVQPSGGTPDQHNHDGGDSDAPESKAAGEVYLIVHFFWLYTAIFGASQSFDCRLESCK